MERIHSLDFLRGITAFMVVLPHSILLFGSNIYVESISIISVEIFFIISGFVLAPQIILIKEKQIKFNHLIFLFRRWIRTVIPYVIALIFVGLISSNLFTYQFFAKLFFIDSFYNVNNNDDFYSISWSLVVEEWYYLIIIILVFFFKNTDLKKILIISFIYFMLLNHDIQVFQYTNF